MNAELYYYVCGIILVAGMILWITNLFFSSFLGVCFRIIYTLEDGGPEKFMLDGILFCFSWLDVCLPW